MDVSTKVKATTLLWEDHRSVEDLYQRFKDAEDSGAQADLVAELFRELEIHCRLEESLFYPDLAMTTADKGWIEQFGEEHAEVKRLISEYRLIEEDDGIAPAGCAVLLGRIMANVECHVAGEEANALPILKADPGRDETLGVALHKLKMKLKLVPPVHKRIVVNVPVRVAYNQWTQFEDFPHMLENVKEVRQLDDSHVQWLAGIAGKDVRWTAEIYEQVPDQRIAWRSIDGAPNTGSVTFRPLASASTLMLVEIAYEPQGLLEDLGAMLGMVSRSLDNGLNNFKKRIEARPMESGAWRGKIEGRPLEL